MSIVNWTTDNVDVSQIESSEEVVMKILQMNEMQLANRWEGKLIIKPRGFPKVSVELRKYVGASVVIKIHDRPARRPGADENKMVQISMSQSAKMSLDDLAEMQLAIDEGVQVYRLPAHWIKLNKYLEESKGRQERRTNGKFTKQTI